MVLFDKWDMEPGVTGVLVFFLLNMKRGYEERQRRGWPPMPASVWWVLVNVAG
ncbi:hypothetical protein ARSEF4850_001720 [Beauveria asiatica]